MILRVPVTATNMVEWVRLAANAINSLIRTQDGIVTGTTALPSVTYQPQPLPGSPIAGQTVFDEADDTMKTWDGAAWRSHW